jgi:hypothetical protein
MPTITQILAASYPAVINARNKAANQFAESALLREFERQKFVMRKSLGPTIEHTLDYIRNPGTDFLATDLTTTSLSKVEVLTAASYTPGALSVPIVWSKMDEAKNPSENQKIALVSALIDNALTSHDDALEEALFSTSTDGFLGLQNILPDSGNGSPGGIDASVDAWWRNYSSTYYDDGSNIVAAATTAWNTAAKGSGGSAPTLVVSEAEAQAFYEGALQTQQRFIDVKEADGGFKVLALKTARWVFSQYGTARIYFMSPKHFHLTVSREAYRDKGETSEIPNAQAYVCKLFSLLQFTTSNKSRGAVLTETAAP